MFSKLYNILDKNQKNKLFIFVFLIFLSTILEILGIYLVIPVSSIIFDVNNDSKLVFISYLVENIKLSFYENYKIIIVVFFAGIFTLKTLLIIYINYFQINVLNQFNRKLNIDLIHNKLHSEYIEFTKYKSQDYFQPTIKETNFFVQRILLQFMILISDLPIIIIFSISALLINFQLSIIIISVFFVLIIFYYNFFKKRLDNFGRNRYLQESNRIELINQIFNSIRDINLYKKHRYFFNQFKILDFEYFKGINVISFLTLLPRILLEYISILLISLFFVYLIYNDSNTIQSIPVIAFIVVAIGRLLPLANRILISLQSLKFFKPSFKLILDELDKKSEIIRTELPKIKINSSFEIKNIFFKFNKKSEKTYLFENINFQIKNNEIVGIYGDSGSGKSTLINIMSGLINPDRGEILIDGNSLKNSQYMSLRDLFSIISQNSNLIADTIKKNIAFGLEDSEIDNDKLIMASKQASIFEFVNSLESGFESKINEKAFNISGGQKQRVEIARAIYFDREFLILDEATNSLDKDNEINIFTTLKSLKAEKKILIISHDVQKLKFCDRVYKIENKKLILNKF